MNKKKTLGEAGFGHILIIVIVVVVLAFIGLVVYKQATGGHHNDSVSIEDYKGPAPVMKSIGFNLDYYNEATNKAGDMVFTKDGLPFDQIWQDFGQQDPRAANDPTKKNPQPYYILPLGTKVLSLVDGTVSHIETLYSGDTTLWVKPNEGSPYQFETEHILNPVVKVGDKVKSGQVIGEVSDHDSKYHPGFGILEIGVLGQNGDAPTHSCPYMFLDASVKDDIFAKITALHTSWEKYIGKTVYKEKFAIPGCVFTDVYNG